MNRAEHGKSERHWDPELAGQKVRLRDSPGRQGVTTGRIKQAGSFLLVEVGLGPNEKQFKRYDPPEPVKAGGGGAKCGGGGAQRLRPVRFCVLNGKSCPWRARKSGRSA